VLFRSVETFVSCLVGGPAADWLPNIASETVIGKSGPVNAAERDRPRQLRDGRNDVILVPYVVVVSVGDDEVDVLRPSEEQLSLGEKSGNVRTPVAV
jgi:hypothetical protein